MIARRRLGLALLLGALPVFTAPPAEADDKKACVDAYVKAQRLRQDAKLRGAREQLLVCAVDSCPASLRQDCTQWMAEVDTAMPSVVIEVKGPDGRDAVDVKVTMDGELLVSKLEGTTLPVDPGVHSFRYEIEGAEPVEQKVVIRVGDKNRKLAVDFQHKGGGPSGSTGPISSGAPAPDRPSETTRPIPPLVFVFGGLALVGAAGFTVFALRTDAQVGDLDDQGCKGHCAQSDVDDAKTSQTLGYVALGVTAVSLGVAAVLFFTRPEKPKATQSAVLPHVEPLPGGALAGVRAVF